MHTPKHTHANKLKTTSARGHGHAGLWLTLIAMGLCSSVAQGQARLSGGVAQRLQAIEVQQAQVDVHARAGVAAALASAQLSQANQPGQQVLSMSGSQWRGEGGHSIGWSGVSDEGDMVWRTSMSGSGDRQQGVTAAIGYQF